MSTTSASRQPNLSGAAIPLRKVESQKTDSGLWLAVSGPLLIALTVAAVSWLSRLSF